MSFGILISSTNYNGQLGDITYYPDTGGTVSIGVQTIPYTYNADYYYGSYEIYFSGSEKTCYAYMDNPFTNFLLQENYSLILQEDNSGILTEGTVSVELTGEYSPGSVNIQYVATSNLTLYSDVEISFVDTLETISGAPLVISGTVLINSGNTVGTSYYSVAENYNNLSKVANFTNVTYSVTGQSVTVLVETNSQFDVTPTPTSSVTPTPTISATPSISVSLTPSISITPSATVSVTPSVTPSITPTISITPTPTSTPTIVTSNLVLYFDPSNPSSYSGSGTVINDLSGNGLNGTMSNITYTSPYFTYNGTSSQIQVADNVLLEPGSGDWTMEVWVNQAVLGNDVVLGKFDNGGLAQDVSYSIRTTNTTYYAQLGSGIGTGSTLFVDSTPYVGTINTWYQIVYVFTNVASNTLQTFVNGVSIGSVGHSLASVLNTVNPLYIGSYNGGEYSQWFDGKIGITRLYNTSLTSSQVLQNFNADKSKYGL